METAISISNSRVRPSNATEQRSAVRSVRERQDELVVTTLPTPRLPLPPMLLLPLMLAAAAAAAMEAAGDADADASVCENCSAWHKTLHKVGILLSLTLHSGGPLRREPRVPGVEGIFSSLP